VLALIADDERNHRTMVKRMLERLGVRVEEFANGQELLQRLEAADPDLIVLDVDMPMMNGLQAIQAIRASAKHQDVPIVFVSSLANPDEVQQLVALGVSDYLLKPIRVDQAIARLGQAVRDATRRRRQARTAPTEGAQ
jgi:CheY-like chemotaxis protein